MPEAFWISGIIQEKNKAAQLVYNDSMRKAIKPILVYCLNLAGRELKSKRHIKQIRRLLQLIAGQTHTQKIQQAIADSKYVQKIRQAIEQQQWDAACALWTKVHRGEPTKLTGSAEGEKALAHCRRENDTAKRLLKQAEEHGKLDYNACKEGAMIIANHAITPVLQERLFHELARALMESAAENRVLYHALFLDHGKVNLSQKPHKRAPFRSQLRQIWLEMPQDDDNVFWFGLAMGFVDEEPTASQVESLLLLELARLGWLFCNHPFHAKTIASFRAYARAATANPAMLNTLPEASRNKLGIVLAGIDYGLLNKLRHVLLPMTKQAVTRGNAVRPKRKLRIAVCISGQLRGYRQVFASWHHLGLERHDADYFVHVWRRIGRKIPLIPSKGHLQRLFTDAFCDAYADALRQHGARDLERAYPGFFRFFTAGGDCVTQAELQRFYRTDAVVAEDDAAAPFCELITRKRCITKRNKRIGWRWKAAKTMTSSSACALTKRHCRRARRLTGGKSAKTASVMRSFLPTGLCTWSAICRCRIRLPAAPHTGWRHTRPPFPRPSRGKA